jgi:hypothetical protein
MTTPIRLAFERAATSELPVRLVFGETEGGGTPEPPASTTVSLIARIARLTGSVGVNYESRTPRPTVGSISACWHDAAPLQRGLAGGWHSAEPLPVVRQARWQRAQPLCHALQGAWADADRSARALAAVAFQQAMAINTWPLAATWQQAVRGQAAAAALYQEAQRVGAWPVASAFQQALRDRRRFVQSLYQKGQRQSAGFVETESDGIPSRTGQRSRYQEARRPPIGRWVRPAVPPAPDPCYLPTLPVRLVFSEAGGAGMPLVFVCERHTPPGPQPGGTVVVPVRRVYMTINHLTLLRVDGAVPIPAESFAMSIDVDSWTWQWSASLPGEALELVLPDASGDPVDVQATINGTPYRLAAEGVSRERSFGRNRVNVKGRGRAAVLDAPYAPVLNHGNSGSRTAQQLMADVLSVNGVGIGWDVDWGIADWLVPGNVWSHQGSYISALLDIADAAGAYLQPHDTAPTLRMLHRYPSAPWDWAGLPPDFELPSAVVAVEGIEWQRKAPYNRVFVSGASAGGVLGQVTRAGTAGSPVAPMVTHPLITHTDVARQRGRAALGDTGSQAHISLRLPVLEQTGVIKPGALVRYVDGGTDHLGLVRSTQLEWQRPTLRQVLSVETHPA